MAGTVSLARAPAEHVEVAFGVAGLFIVVVRESVEARACGAALGFGVRGGR